MPDLTTHQYSIALPRVQAQALSKASYVERVGPEELMLRRIKQALQTGVQIKAVKADREDLELSGEFVRLFIRLPADIAVKVSAEAARRNVSPMDFIAAAISKISESPKSLGNPAPAR